MGIAASSALRDESAGNGTAYGSLEMLGGARKLKKKPVLVLDPEELEAAHAMFQDASADLLGDNVEQLPRPSNVLGLAPMEDEDFAEMNREDDTIEEADADLPTPEDILNITRRKSTAIEADMMAGDDGFDESGFGDMGELLDEDIDLENRIFPSLPIQEDLREDDMAAGAFAEDDRGFDPNEHGELGDEPPAASDSDVGNFPSLPPQNALSAGEPSREDERLEHRGGGNFGSLLGTYASDDDDHLTPSDHEAFDEEGENEEEVAGDFASLAREYDGIDSEKPALPGDADIPEEDAVAGGITPAEGVFQADADDDTAEAEEALDLPVPPLASLGRAEDNQDHPFDSAPLPGSEPAVNGPKPDESQDFESDGFATDNWFATADDFDEDEDDEGYFVPDFAAAKLAQEPLENLPGAEAELEPDTAGETSEPMAAAEARDLPVTPETETEDLTPELEAAPEPEPAADSPVEEGVQEGAADEALDDIYELTEELADDKTGTNAGRAEQAFEDAFVAEDVFEDEPATEGLAGHENSAEEFVAEEPIAEDFASADIDDSYTLVDDDLIDGTAFMHDPRSRRSTVTAAPRGQQSSLRAKLLREAEEEAKQATVGSQSLLGRLWASLRRLFG